MRNVILIPSLSVMLSDAKHLSFPLRAGSAKNLDGLAYHTIGREVKSA
jgi:hypothetical protein